MIVLGVDPGSLVCGLGVVRRDGSTLQRIDSGVVRISPTEALEHRLVYLYDAVREAIVVHQPIFVAVESVFHHRNAKAALTLGHARGAILLACAKGGVEVVEYPPAQVKRAVTGNGAATKKQVRRMVELSLGITVDGPDDETDALAVAICHAQSIGLQRAIAAAESR